jgi:hypothetical protein
MQKEGSGKIECFLDCILHVHEDVDTQKERSEESKGAAVAVLI